MQLRNRVKELRLKARLTQRELAQAAGTSQQQVQRIEVGLQSVRHHLAARIASSLGMPLDRVFPTPKSPKSDARSRSRSPREEDQQPGGIDQQIELWTLKIRLRGGAEEIIPIAPEDKERLWNQVSSGSDDFIVFQSDKARIAINPAHLLACQFRFDADYDASLPADQALSPVDEKHVGTRVYLCDSSEPLEFDVVPDTSEFCDEKDDGSGYINQSAFVDLETDPEPKERISLVDDDGGETVFFRIGDLAMLSIPLDCCEPALLNSIYEGDAEEEATAREDEAPC